MTDSTRAAQSLDPYLQKVRAGLRDLPAADADEIIRELRSHIVELTSHGEDVETALRSLGDPVDLAKTYRAENLLVQAECSGSPLVILQGLRHASQSRWGRFFVTALYFFGYANVLALWAAGIEKVIGPGRTGLWYTPGKDMVAQSGDGRRRTCRSQGTVGLVARTHHSRRGLGASISDRLDRAVVDPPVSPLQNRSGGVNRLSRRVTHL
jgi:hypothetical protein